MTYIVVAAIWIALWIIVYIAIRAYIKDGDISPPSDSIRSPLTNVVAIASILVPATMAAVVATRIDGWGLDLLVSAISVLLVMLVLTLWALYALVGKTSDDKIHLRIPDHRPIILTACVPMTHFVLALVLLGLAAYDFSRNGTLTNTGPAITLKRTLPLPGTARGAVHKSLGHAQTSNGATDIYCTPDGQLEILYDAGLAVDVRLFSCSKGKTCTCHQN